MKKKSLLKLQKKRNTNLRQLMVISLLILLVQPMAAQYYTKVETGDLPEALIKTYSASFADYNNDGFDDVLIVGTIDYPSTLFLNNGDGSFTEKTDNVIYTTTGPSIACSWGDYNNDGNIDLYICNTGNTGDETAANFLFRNDGGGNFTRILEGEIVTDQDWSLGASWADYDNDGFIDLYVSNFIQENRLYKNNGDGSFTKITEGEIVTDNFNTYSANWVDYDNDGFQDLYVVNYFYSALPGQDNCLYHNNGDGTFTKNTTSIIANDSALTQGSSWGDFNNDGLMDVYITVNDFADIKHNFLYKNIGNGDFELVNSTPSTDGGQTFGSAWLDIDNDGYLDLTVSNNGGSQRRLNNLYKNNGDETFTDQTDDASTQTPIRDFCSTISDYNNDGYADIFTPSYSTTIVHGLYKNNGGDNNWISIRLEGVISNRSAIGARIYCYSNGMVQTREVASSTGQYTGSSLVQTFGIGSETSIDRIEIFWPSGIHQVISNPNINEIHQIPEESANNATDILSFSLDQQTGGATIDTAAHTVSVEVENGTDLTTLTPEITVSAGATITPGSGETVDFSNGAVSYFVTAENGTDSQEWMVTVSNAPLGTNDNNSNEVFKIYPNPAKTDGDINVIASQTGIYELRIMNYVGQKVKDLKVDLQRGENKTVNLGTLEQGIYIVQISSNGKQATHKLVITK